MKILIVDDENDIRRVLKLLLGNRGYEVAEAENGARALEILSGTDEFDLVIMDMMMPVLSGVSTTKKLREFSDVPVLFLTAKSLDRDKTSAYAAGGDDYLVKPFSSKELLLKVDAITRRYNAYRSKTAPADPGDTVSIGAGVTVSPKTRTVRKNGTEIDIRDKEYDVLLYLVGKRGTTVGQRELYEQVWGEIPLASSANTVTVHILNLRRQLEDDPQSPKLIRTVWGKGYQID